MKLVVPLMIPAIHSIRFAVRPSRSALTIGIPPATAASKATTTPLSRAAAKISVPCTASSALFAVTTCLPAAIASRTSAFATPVPPISSTMTSISGREMTDRASATTSAAPAASAPARTVSRSAMCVMRISRPALLLISSWLRCRTLKVPPPTTPAPSNPTRIGFIDMRRRCSSSLRMARAVVVEERGDAADRLGQIVRVRQEDDPEVVGPRPVEARPLDDQHLLLGEQLVGELLVVLDRVDRRVELREHVERRLRLDAADAGNRSQQLVGEVALAAQAPARGDQVVDALVAAERGLDRELPRRVRAQAHRGEHAQALDVIAGVPLLPGDDHPAGAIAARAIVLRQAVEGKE